MSRLVTDLLLLGEAQASEFLLRAELSLDSLVAEIVEQARAQADDRQVGLGALEAVSIFGDRDRLKQQLWNLAGNAPRYTSPRGRIELPPRSHGIWAEVAVADY